MLEELRVGFLVTSTSVALITCEGSNGEGRQRSKHSSAFLQVLFGTRRVCAREAPWAQRRSAECWRRSSGRGRGLRPSNRPGYCEHHRSRFSLKGRLERVELGVPSLFECIVKIKKGHIEPPGLRVRVRFRPVSWLESQPPHVAPPTLDSALLGAVGSAAHHTRSCRPRGPEARARRLQRRGHPLPPARPTVGCRFRAGGFGPASPSFSTKSSRCVAFFGVKPSPGQSEISAFFQEHGNTKGLRGEIVKRKPFLFRLNAVGRLKLSFEILQYSWWWGHEWGRVKAPSAAVCALLSPAHLQTQVVLHLKEGREGNVGF